MRFLKGCRDNSHPRYYRRLYKQFLGRFLSSRSVFEKRCQNYSRPVFAAFAPLSVHHYFYTNRLYLFQTLHKSHFFLECQIRARRGIVTGGNRAATTLTTETTEIATTTAEYTTKASNTAQTNRPNIKVSEPVFDFKTLANTSFS